LGQPLDLGFAKVNSLALERNLQGCKKIVLFAATAGIGIDRLIVKYNKLSPAKAVVYQAMGAALVEQWCDILHAKFQQELGANKSRFSCGYGDLPLTLQRDIFTALNVTKNLGITLSDNCFMTPTKSVTAIVGIK
jgi:cobalamin-dependent methionine synthase I